MTAAGTRTQPARIVANAFARAAGRPVLALVALCLVLFLPGFFQLPVMDRDEARFVQATKQMVETGDFVVIRFQDELRNKKPIGIHWLQSGAVLASGQGAAAPIEIYRIPSLLGAIAVVLLTFWAGLRLTGREAALAGAMLMACALVLTAEAKLAKTDAVLCAAILLAMGALARLYMDARDGVRPRARDAALFWLGVGAAVLIKGPVVGLVAGATIAALCLWDREVRWLAGLRALWGVPLALCVVAPWMIAIGIETEGAFFREALIDDFAAKVKSGQESHWGPPGYYLATLFLSFFPATLFVIPAVARAIAARHAPAMRFLLAWAVPAFLVFELVPTKLPHYTLPLLPALALMCGALVRDAPDAARAAMRGVAGRMSLALWLIGGITLAAGAALAPMLMGGATPIHAWPMAALVLVALSGGAVLAWRGRVRAAAGFAGASAVALYAALGFATIPALDDLKLSARAAALIAAHADGDAPIGSAGYSEPSLVFQTRTDLLLSNAAAMADLLGADPKARVLIAGGPRPRDARHEEAFRARLSELGIAAVPLGAVSGLNYSRGRPVTLTLYGREAGP